jgi:hypothetical protein
LDISDNAFDGTIPTEIGLLTNLYHIAGEGNRLRGSLPNEMLNMNRNLRLNFTNNLYDPQFQGFCVKSWRLLTLRRPRSQPYRDNSGDVLW